MPSLKLQTSVNLSPEQQATLMPVLSRRIATVLQKPEAYVMLVLQSPAPIWMGGETGAAAFVELYSIGGLTEATNNELVAMLAQELAVVGIPPERLYVAFIDSPATHFGWNGTTFA